MEKIKRVRFRCSEAERGDIRDKAETAGLTLSEFVRRTAQGRKTLSIADREMVGELRRLGAMLKHFYPKNANWTVEEKRRYWAGHEQLMALAQKIQDRNKNPGGG
ncbi:MAG: plasmid mobilization protein [Thiobacillaceae bacterium]